MTDDGAAVVDAIVLGMGPGGEQVAGDLADAGLDVVGVEAGLVGGECPYYGCIPTKIMVRAAGLLAEARRVDGVAGTTEVVPSWAPVAARIREATDDWSDTAAADRFEGKGGTLVRGAGKLVAADTVVVGDRRYRARSAVVVATGTSPSIPPIDGLDATPFWTNRDAVRATELPDSLIVLGGGAIGVELAQVFARFGVEVTVVEAADRLVPNEDPAAGELLAEVFADDGIEVVTGIRATRVAHEAGRFTVILDDDRTLDADRLLVATGRQVDLGAIGAESIGVDPSARALEIDGRCRVTDGVWAVGDVTGMGMFTHVAIWQGRIAAADILDRDRDHLGAADDAAVPRVTFTDPEIGSVGLSEADARERGIDVAVGTADLSESGRGTTHGVGNDGLIKLVADRDRGLLIGATSIGPTGGEVLGLLTLAVHAEVPIDRLRSMIYAYPTFHRSVESALTELAERL